MNEFTDTLAWTVLEILAGCDYLSNPEGEGFEKTLRCLVGLELVSKERMEAGGWKAAGYRLEPAGEALVRMVKAARGEVV